MRAHRSGHIRFQSPRCRRTSSYQENLDLISTLPDLYVSIASMSADFFLRSGKWWGLVLDLPFQSPRCRRTSSYDGTTGEGWIKRLVSIASMSADFFLRNKKVKLTVQHV